MANKVIHPEHYNKNGMETIDVIKASMNPEEFKGFLTGNVIKYLGRYPYKNGVEDLEKAKWYLEKLIDETDTDERLAETKSEDGVDVTVVSGPNETYKVYRYDPETKLLTVTEHTGHKSDLYTGKEM